MTSNALARTSAAAFAAAVLGAGCSSGSSPAQTAERITRAVYANDMDTTIGSFDDATKKNVTRSELGLVSDKMHELGAITGFSQRTADPDKGRYDYDVSFSNGAMLVQMRLDPNGKVGGYYVMPEAPRPTTAAK